jgi:hypothetical protein
MTAKTFGVVAAKAGIGIPVDGATRLNFVCRVALFVEILPVFVLDSYRISRPVGKCERAEADCNPTKYGKQRCHGRAE